MRQLAIEGRVRRELPLVPTLPADSTEAELQVEDEVRGCALLLVRILAGDFNFEGMAVRTAAILFATAAGLQMIFIFRGYWRMDI